jgi:hypothetical protein
MSNYNRTVLYYPTIKVPEGKWLKQALLYWDNVASIVPYDYDGNVSIPFTSEIEFLLDEKIFKPVRPEKLFNRRTLVRDFKDKLKDYQKYIKDKDKKQRKQRGGGADGGVF